jgi:hypothetical protein
MTIMTLPTQPPDQPLGPITSPHGPPPLTRTKFCRKSARKIRSSPQKKSQQPHATNRLKPRRHYPLINQHNPCRGSSIGRACGSYNSKEINLKVVGSSPTFGYSYHTSSLEQLFFCSFDAGFDWWFWWMLVGFFWWRGVLVDWLPWITGSLRTESFPKQSPSHNGLMASFVPSSNVCPISLTGRADAQLSKTKSASSQSPKQHINQANIRSIHERDSRMKKMLIPAACAIPLLGIPTRRDHLRLGYTRQ